MIIAPGAVLGRHVDLEVVPAREDGFAYGARQALWGGHRCRGLAATACQVGYRGGEGGRGLLGGCLNQGGWTDSNGRKGRRGRGVVSRVRGGSFEVVSLRLGEVLNADLV